jgi:hypothetical protein
LGAFMVPRYASIALFLDRSVYVLPRESVVCPHSSSACRSVKMVLMVFSCAVAVGGDHGLASVNKTWARGLSTHASYFGGSRSSLELLAVGVWTLR